MQILFLLAFYWDDTFNALPAFAVFFFGGGVGAGSGVRVAVLM